MAAYTGNALNDALAEYRTAIEVRVHWEGSGHRENMATADSMERAARRALRKVIKSL